MVDPPFGDTRIDLTYSSKGGSVGRPTAFEPDSPRVIALDVLPATYQLMIGNIRCGGSVVVEPARESLVALELAEQSCAVRPEAVRPMSDGPSGAVTGRLRSGLGPTRIDLRAEDPELVGSVGSTVPDSGGRFLLAPVQPGRYVVEVSQEQQVIASIDVVVTPGSVNEVAIEPDH